MLWSTVFITVSVLYRPVEQLLSRTIADREARGQPGRAHLGLAAAIQLGLVALFLVAALALRGPLERRLFAGSGTLYWVLVVAVVAYAASYFARGFLAGHRYFGFYGSLLLLESASRLSFAVVVVVGIASGQSALALGIAVAPLVSLTILPLLAVRRLRRAESPAATSRTHADESDEGASGAFTLTHGAGFAAAVVCVMLAEQTFLNAGPLILRATAHDGSALAGFAFNVLLIARAPLQLFQAVQTSILPHLTRQRAHGAAASFERTIALTIRAIACFAASVALLMLVAGPTLMRLAFGGSFGYGRLGLAAMGVGMGLYLTASTLNQAALSRLRAGRAALCWLAAASAFVVFLALPLLGDRITQVEVGFVGGAALLCALLYRLYRTSGEAEGVRP